MRGRQCAGPDCTGGSRLYASDRAGLGKGTSEFSAFRTHTFPGSRRASDIWSDSEESDEATIDLPADRALAAAGVDRCGLTRLAGVTVGAPFVGVIAASLVIGDLLRLTAGAHVYDLIDATSEISRTPHSDSGACPHCLSIRAPLDRSTALTRGSRSQPRGRLTPAFRARAALLSQRSIYGSASRLRQNVTRTLGVII